MDFSFLLGFILWHFTVSISSPPVIWMIFAIDQYEISLQTAILFYSGKRNLTES